MAKRRKTTGMLTYNLLVKEVCAINRNLPDTRRLSRAEIYQFISKKIYPLYKGVSKSRVRLRILREIVYNKIRTTPRKKGCNLLAIPREDYQDIEYYVIEDFITRILPPCINIKINADGFGETNIFNTRDFNYHASGIGVITNRINQYKQQNPHKKYMDSPGFRYFGIVQLIPGKLNNANPENYYLEMILEGPAHSVTYEKPFVAVRVPKKKRNKRQKKQDRDIKQYIIERVGNLKKEKSRIKLIRKKIEQKIHKDRGGLDGLTKSQKQERRNTLFLIEKKKIDKYYSDNVINERQYQSLINRLKSGYRQ